LGYRWFNRSIKYTVNKFGDYPALSGIFDTWFTTALSAMGCSIEYPFDKMANFWFKKGGQKHPPSLFSVSQNQSYLARLYVSS